MVLAGQRFVDVVVEKRRQDGTYDISRKVNVDVAELIDLAVLKVGKDREHRADSDINTHARKRREPSRDVNVQSDDKISLDLSLDEAGIGI